MWRGLESWPSQITSTGALKAMNSSNNSSTGIDKQALYGQFQRGLDEDRKLGLKAAYKALDIPMDDMNIKATTNHHYHPPVATPSGIGTLAKLAIGGAIAATGVGLPVGAYFVADAIKSLKTPAAVVPEVPDASKYDLRILDE